MRKAWSIRAEAARLSAAFTRTENGAVALNTTGDARLDFFGTVGSLRTADKERITRLFSEAWKADPLFATRIAFYARDVRGGLGERQTFRTILQYMAQYHPEGLRPNLDLIGVYGRYDDMYCLIGTPLEDEMWAAMKKQFEEDRMNMEAGNAISLLAKWIKTADVEALMSAGRWDEIRYAEVPSRAMMIYRNAFMRHDEERFGEFVQRAVRGEETVHSATLYPYDIIEKVMEMHWNGCRIREDEALEAQWRQLPDYVEAGTNALVIADTSGSMMGRPLATSVGLAVYFAERNTGAYHNMFMSFSGTSRIQVLKGDTLAQKLRSIDMNDWANNTNLEAAFKHVLEIAVRNRVPAEEMPKSLIVISDMEIDFCGNKNWTFYEKMAQKFRKFGYQIPNIIFWNVASRHDVFHADKGRAGVQLASGQSAAVFRQVMQCIGLNPVEAMEKIIGSERYAAIEVA